MSIVLPAWLARLLGVPIAESGEGTLATLRISWAWSLGATFGLVLLIAVVVYAVYFREAGSAGRFTRALLGTIRLVLFGLVLFMLAEAVLMLQRTGLPTLVLVIDDSASMATIDRYDTSRQAELAARLKHVKLDDATRLNLAKTLLLENDANLLAALRERYDLRVYFVSSAARRQSAAQPELMKSLRALPAEGEASRLGQAVRTVLDDLRGAPPAAIVLLTDGVTTEGESLSEVAELARTKGVPLYSIGLGSVTPVADLALTDLLVDDVVFVDDLVNFEIKLIGSALKGRQVDVVLREDGVEVARQRVAVPADGEPEKLSLVYRPTKTGDFQYVVEVDKLSEEPNHANNVRQQTVSVRKAEIKVLLVQQQPNYEYRFFKQLFSREAAGADKPSDESRRRSMISLKTVLLDADVEYTDATTLPDHVFPVRREDLFAYDVLIFGDVNPRYLSATALQNIHDFVIERGRGLIFIAGPKFTPLAYRGTPLAPLFPIDLTAAVAPDPAADIVDGFVVRPTALGQDSANMLLGDSAAQSLQIWQKLPPLYWLLEAPARPIARVLAEHPTKLDAQGRPLPVFSLMYAGAGKVLFHATDETWRWRRRRGDEWFARYWQQSIRMLCRAKLGNQTAELTTDRLEYRAGENVQLRLRFQDDRLAPAADDGVTVTVEQAGGGKSSVQLRRSSAARGVFEGLLTRPVVGRYRAWVVDPPLPGEPSAEFAVSVPPGELQRTTLDERELTQAAKITRGRFYTWDTADRLRDELPVGRQVPIESLPALPLWNRWETLATFLVLLVTEWILRKRKGML